MKGNAPKDHELILTMILLTIDIDHWEWQ